MTDHAENIVVSSVQTCAEDSRCGSFKMKNKLGCSVLMRKPYYARDLCTHVKEVSGHAAAVTHFVPVGSLGARIVEVSRQAAVITVPVWALSGKVSMGAAKEARNQLLFSQKKKQKHNTYQFVKLVLKYELNMNICGD